MTQQQPDAVPPSPHDPREREQVATLGDWELRVFPQSDVKFAYFLSKGFWHLQLWSPAMQVSVLTPSKLTDGAYEVFSRAERRLRLRSRDALALQLLKLSAPPLDLALLHQADQIHVEAMVRQAFRLSVGFGTSCNLLRGA